MPILRFDRVTKRYGQHEVFLDLNLSVSAGDFILLTGPNGAGKTTLLRLMSAYAAPSSGRIEWLLPSGAPPRRLDRAEGRCAVVSHHPLVYDELTVQENVEFRLRLQRAADVRGRTSRWLETFGLMPRAREPVAALSRGLKQRLALAQAFAVEAPLMLLDEPAASLDAPGVDALLNQLGRVRGAATVVVASHEPDRFRSLASRRWELSQGVVREAEPAS